MFQSKLQLLNRLGYLNAHSHYGFVLTVSNLFGHCVNCPALTLRKNRNCGPLQNVWNIGIALFHHSPARHDSLAHQISDLAQANRIVPVVIQVQGSCNSSECNIIRNGLVIPSRMNVYLADVHCQGVSKIALIVQSKSGTEIGWIDSTYIATIHAMCSSQNPFGRYQRSTASMAKFARFLCVRYPPRHLPGEFIGHRIHSVHDSIGENSVALAAFCRWMEIMFPLFYKNCLLTFWVHWGTDEQQQANLK